jgi:alanine dehydrogenase
MIFLSAQETQALLDWPAVVGSIESAYRSELPASATPRRSIAQIDGTWLRCMPAITPSGRYLGTKQIVRSRGKVTYLITLFDQRDASLAFMLDGLEITRIRTAATTVAAMRLLGDRSGIRLGVLGSGLEAQTHLEAFTLASEIASVKVFSPSEDRRAAFAQRVRHEFKIAAEAVDTPAAAVRGATHVIAAARSRDETPILNRGMLDADVLVASIGSTVPSQRELDADVIGSAQLIVADDPKELAEETGDMIAAARAGVSFADKLFSLRQLVRGEIPQHHLKRPALRLFKSLGSALQDLVFAEWLVDRAKAKGIGTELPVSLVEKSGLRKAGGS